MAAKHGQNETLMLLKKEFPDIKGTLNAFNYALLRNRVDTLNLLKKEFPELCPK